MLSRIAFPCSSSSETQLFRFKDPERRRCDAMREITGDDIEHRKNVQITEVSKIPRIQNACEKGKLFDAYKV
jgi:hypothetical protein